MLLYFIRHGETEANSSKTHAGWDDTMLTEKGKEQARKVGKALKDISFDKIYSSDLSRAKDTKELALPGADAEICPIIREINVGSLAKRLVVDCVAEYGETYVENKKRLNFKPYGGESYEEFRARAMDFLDMMEKRPHEKVAVFCHGGIVQAVFDIVFGVFADRASLICENCSVSVFEYNGERWKLKTWNYTGELQ